MSKVDIPFLKNFFYIDSFKSFIEFVITLLLFKLRYFGCEACGILASRAGIKPTLPALEGEVLTTGLLSPFLIMYFLS